MENVRIFAEEGSSATIEVKPLGEPGQEVKGHAWVLWVCEDEVLNGNDFEKMFVLVHQFLKHRVSRS